MKDSPIRIDVFIGTPLRCCLTSLHLPPSITSPHCLTYLPLLPHPTSPSSPAGLDSSGSESLDFRNSSSTYLPVLLPFHGESGCYISIDTSYQCLSLNDDNTIHAMTWYSILPPDNGLLSTRNSACTTRNSTNTVRTTRNSTNTVRTELLPSNDVRLLPCELLPDDRQTGALCARAQVIIVVGRDKSYLSIIYLSMYTSISYTIKSSLLFTILHSLYKAN